MTEQWKIAGISLARGERKLTYLDVAKLASGFDLRIGVHAVSGARPGPTVCVLGTMHGDETLAIDIIEEALEQIDPDCLVGQLVAVPVVNPLSFEAQTYHTPQDMKDINVLTPGNADGSLTEKLAYILTTQIIDHVDCILNLHGAGLHTVNNFTYVPTFVGEVGEKTLELAKVFGQEVLYVGPDRPGHCMGYAARTRGVPGITPEIGTDLMWKEEARGFVDIGVRGIQNVLKYLRMIKGKVERPRKQILLRDRTTFKARHGGLFRPEVSLEDLGKVLPRGSVLGRTVDPQTFEEVERIATQYEEGLLFMVRGRGRTHPGEYMFHVGDLKTAERIE